MDEDRLAKLEKLGDPLPLRRSIVDWAAFRPLLKVIHHKQRKSNAWRKPHDVTLTFKLLVVQTPYNLSDDQSEFPVRARASCQRLLGLSPEDTVPDGKTLWLSREQLARHGLIDKLFLPLDGQLWQSGLMPRGGQITDASLVSLPKNRSTRDENKQIKESKTPDGWHDKPNMKRHKDEDARGAKKQGKGYCGCKHHINVDKEHKLIRRYTVTDASVHDSQMFDEDLDEEDDDRSVWAASAHRSEAREQPLGGRGFNSRIHRKGTSRRKHNKQQHAPTLRPTIGARRSAPASSMSSAISARARATSWCEPRARYGRR